MRKVVLYIAMSLDGFIADKNGSVDWLAGHDKDSQELGSYPEFSKTIDAVVLGYSTYHQIVTELSPDNWPYSGMQSYVLTHRKLDATDEIEFTGENIGGLINRLKKQDGKDIWICGGASVVNQFIGLDLIDNYCVTVIPIILGSGIRLFKSENSQIKLKLISTRSYNGMTDLMYERREIADR